MNIKIKGLLLLILLLAGGIAHGAEQYNKSVALVADNTPIVEFYRNSSGSIRYELNSDILLGMSLGLSPTQLSERINAAPGNTRWHPLFNLLASPPRKSHISLPEQLTRPSRRTRWFLGFGTRRDLKSDGGFDFQDDLSHHFSLQSKAGFVMPIGKRLVLGGAVTLNYQLDDSRRHGRFGSGTGAYLGLKFYY